MFIGDDTTSRNVIIGCIGFVLVINVLILPVNGISLKNFNTKNQTDLTLLNGLEADLKIRKLGGNWENELIVVYIGSILEFKIFVETSIQYKAIAIGVKLPSIDDIPMFNYDLEPLGLGSSEPKPIFPIDEWSANNTDVNWAWLNVDGPWSKTMTFKALIKKAGSESVELTVFGLKDLNGNYDEVYDSVTVLSEKSRFMHLQQLLHQRTRRICDVLSGMNAGASY